MANRQPKNVLAPWGVVTNDGNYVGAEDGGLIATRATIGEIIFADGSSMKTAGVPSDIDAGTF